MQALSQRRFRLSRNIESLAQPGGERLLKQTARGEYLALDQAQQAILDRFDGVRTTREVLQSLFVVETRPRLRPFYDLILTAVAKGFLLEEESEPERPAPRAFQWRLGPSPLAALLLAGVGIVAGAVVVGTQPIGPVQTAPEWLAVVVLTAFGLSLANAFAACVLSGFGRLIHRSRIRWDRGLPFFAFDASDAFMAGRRCEVCMAVAAFSAPGYLLVAAAQWESAAGLLAGCLTALILASPFGNTPAHGLLHALFRRRHALPKCAEGFLRTRLPSHLLGGKNSPVEERYLVAHATWAIGWLGLVCWLATNRLEREGSAFMEAMLRPGAATAWSAMASLVLLMTAVVAPAVCLLGFVLQGVHHLVAPRWFSAEERCLRRQSAGETRSLPELTRFLRSTLLFSQLTPPEIEQAARVLKCVTVPAGQVIVREGEPGDAMFVVYAGTVAVSRDNEAGEAAPVATLDQGDVFGELALLNEAPRNGTVRATVPTRLLALARADFDRLLVATLGADRIRATVQVCGFLRRHYLFGDWPPQPLLRLAQAFTIQDYRAGEVVIAQGQTNATFFLIYEGEFAVRKDGARVGTLGPGDFCGEVSLLRAVPTTAEVVALRAGRCLRVGKETFVRFVCEDFLTGLAIESTADARLGPRRAS
jgi:cAMP-dependent protein kinase regulator